MFKCSVAGSICFVTSFESETCLVTMMKGKWRNSERAKRESTLPVVRIWKHRNEVVFFVFRAFQRVLRSTIVCFFYYKKQLGIFKKMDLKTRGFFRMNMFGKKKEYSVLFLEETFLHLSLFRKTKIHSSCSCFNHFSL